MGGRRVELVNGADHADKIGKVVVVDLDGTVTRGVRGGLVSRHEGVAIFSGVLHATEDLFDHEGGCLTHTNLTIGDMYLSIDWGKEPEVHIEPVGEETS